jgi:HEAT repeat protein
MPLIRKRPGEEQATARDERDPFAMLRAGTPEQRWGAARSLADVAGSIEALGKALAVETDVRVRSAILTSLVRLASPASAAVILPWLRSDDANLRTAALDALRAMAGSVLPMLPALLADADPDVRLLSCEIARCLPSAEATPLLCDVLDREREANVCAAAVDVLAEIGSPLAVPALQRCAKRFRHEAFLDFAIRMAIKRVRTEASGARD